jgi:hypothetical protein
VFERATTQKKRSQGLGLVTLIQRDREHGRFRQDDWVNGWLLDLAGQQHCYGTIVVLIVSIMVDELVQAWTGCQDCSPLKHRNQKQRDNPGSGACEGIVLGAWPLAWFAPNMTGCLHCTILQSRWLIGSAHNLVATLGACKIT